MSGSKRLRLISFVIIFSIIFNLLYIGISKADSLSISGSNQMTAGSSQTLTASGGDGGPYTWIITSGGGTISGTSGSSVGYTAFSTNYNCYNNSVIGVIDSSGQKAYIQIAVNAYNENSVAYREMICITGGSCGWGEYYVEYNCAHQMYPIAGTCPAEDGNIYCSHTGIGQYTNYWPGYVYGYGLTYGDVRTPEMKAAGCCPSSAFGGSGGDGSGKGPGSGNTGPCGGCCIGGAGAGSGSGAGNGPGDDSNSPNTPADSEINIKSGNLYHSQNVAGLTLLTNFTITIKIHWIHAGAVTA